MMFLIAHGHKYDYRNYNKDQAVSSLSLRWRGAASTSSKNKSLKNCDIKKDASVSRKMSIHNISGYLHYLKCEVMSNMMLSAIRSSTRVNSMAFGRSSSLQGDEVTDFIEGVSDNSCVFRQNSEGGRTRSAYPRSWAQVRHSARMVPPPKDKTFHVSFVVIGKFGQHIGNHRRPLMVSRKNIEFRSCTSRPEAGEVAAFETR